MMRITKTLIALATTLSLVSTPVMAASKTAQSAVQAPVAGSLQGVRAGSKVRKSEKALATPVIVLLVIAGGIGIAAAAGAFDGGSDSP
jgi:hypothetical protein